MSVLNDLMLRQTVLSGKYTGSQRWILKRLQCHHQDQLAIHGRLLGEKVPVFCSKFSPDGLSGHLLAIADEDGSVRLLDTRKPLSTAFISEMACHENAIFDVAWLPGGSKLLTASGDRTVCQWDVVGGAKLGTFKGHPGSIKAVDCNKSQPCMLLSSCREGVICVWDTRCLLRERPVQTISRGHVNPDRGVARKRRRKHGALLSAEATPSVTSVLFHGDNRVASSGSVDGSVKVWDLRKTYSSTKVPLAWLTYDAVRSHNGKYHGFTSLVADSYQGFLYATCTNNIVYKYNTGGLITRPVGAFSGCIIDSYYVKLSVSANSTHLLSGSSCGNGFIWEIDKPDAPPLVLPSEASEITAVDWCRSLDKLVVCSAECDVSVWRVAGERTTSSPGVTTCREYVGDGHLKAREILEEKCLSTPIRMPLLPRNVTEDGAASKKRWSAAGHREGTKRRKPLLSSTNHKKQSPLSKQTSPPIRTSQSVLQKFLCK